MQGRHGGASPAHSAAAPSDTGGLRGEHVPRLHIPLLDSGAELGCGRLLGGLRKGSDHCSRTPMLAADDRERHLAELGLQGA